MFLLSSDTAAAGGIGIGFTLVYIVVIVVIMYFLAIRPQKKEQKKLNAMLAELAVGDSVVTTSGFYRKQNNFTEKALDFPTSFFMHHCNFLLKNSEK